MITVTETSKRELATPEEILAFLSERYAAQDPDRFAPGTRVRIKSRTGLGPEYGIGDVGVVLFDGAATAAWVHVLVLNTAGLLVVMQMPRDSLEPAGAAGE